MNIVEVFVEDNCSSCEEVLRVLQGFEDQARFLVRVWNRNSDAEEFQSRRVLLSPATFINRRLVFYGAFSKDDFDRQLKLFRLKRF